MTEPKRRTRNVAPRPYAESTIGVTPGNRYPREIASDEDPGILRKLAAGVASPVEKLYDISQGDYAPLGYTFVDGPGWVQDNPDALAETALEFAGLGVTGGLATAATRGNSLGIFGGKLAKTADLAALDRAEAMAAKGLDRQTILDDTGWFKGVDGKWRFEIPDDGSAVALRAGEDAHAQSVAERKRIAVKAFTLASEMKRRNLSAEDAAHYLSNAYGDVFAPDEIAFARNHSYDEVGTERAEALFGLHRTPLNKLVHHPELFAAYPDIATMPVRQLSDGEARTMLGGYSPELDKIAYSPQLLDDDEFGRSVMLHELQHAVQSREGFSNGTNGQEGTRAALDSQNILWTRRAADEFGEPAVEWARKIARLFDPVANGLGRPSSVYEANAGEVEARAVQTRRDLAPSTLRDQPPWQSFDIPEDLQITQMERPAKPEPMPLPTDAEIEEMLRENERFRRQGGRVRQRASGGRVTVQKGDSLWKIAERELGDGRRYVEIAEANGLSDANRLSVGQALIIPGKDAEVDMPLPRTRDSGLAGNAMFPSRPEGPASGMPPDERLLAMRGLEGMGGGELDLGAQIARDMVTSRREFDERRAAKRAEMKAGFDADWNKIYGPEDPAIPEGRGRPAFAQDPSGMEDQRSGINKLLASILTRENLLADLGLVDPDPVLAKGQDRVPPTPDMEMAGYADGGPVYGKLLGFINNWTPAGPEYAANVPGAGTVGVDFLTGVMNYFGGWPPEGRQQRARGGFVGALVSDVPGRTDEHPIDVPDGAYVIPADIVSGYGEGNTLAGLAKLREVLALEDDETERRSAGGAVVPIMAAGGELVVGPKSVSRLGSGDLKQGHRVLDRFVERSRQKLIRQLKKLPGPVKE